MPDKWTAENNIKLLLAIIEFVQANPGKTIPWAKMAEVLGPGFTLEAARQHFAALKKAGYTSPTKPPKAEKEYTKSLKRKRDVMKGEVDHAGLSDSDTTLEPRRLFKGKGNAVFSDESLVHVAHQEGAWLGGPVKKIEKPAGKKADMETITADETTLEPHRLFKGKGNEVFSDESLAHAAHQEYPWLRRSVKAEKLSVEKPSVEKPSGKKGKKLEMKAVKDSETTFESRCLYSGKGNKVFPDETEESLVRLGQRYAQINENLERHRKSVGKKVEIETVKDESFGM